MALAELLPVSRVGAQVAPDVRMSWPLTKPQLPPFFSGGHLFTQGPLPWRTGWCAISQRGPEKQQSRGTRGHSETFKPVHVIPVKLVRREGVSAQGRSVTHVLIFPPSSSSFCFSWGQEEKLPGRNSEQGAFCSISLISGGITSEKAKGRCTREAPHTYTVTA